MLLTIAIVLAILWLLGVIVVHIASPLLHLVLLIALIVFIYDFLAKHKKT